MTARSIRIGRKLRIRALAKCCAAHWKWSRASVSLGVRAVFELGVDRVTQLCMWARVTAGRTIIFPVRSLS